jgi:hypothetical protein
MKIQIFDIPIISAIAVIVSVIQAINYGIDVRSIIAREAAGLLPALA